MNIALSPSPSPTVYRWTSNRPNKTPTMQAKRRMNWNNSRKQIQGEGSGLWSPPSPSPPPSSNLWVFSPTCLTTKFFQRQKSMWLNVRQPGTVSNGLNAWQSDIFTDVPPKGCFKLLRNNKCLFRNVKRFPKIDLVFLVDKLCELEHTTISLGCQHLKRCTSLIGLPGTVSNWLNSRQSEVFTKMPLKGSLKL